MAGRGYLSHLLECEAMKVYFHLYVVKNAAEICPGHLSYGLVTTAKSLNPELDGSENINVESFFEHYLIIGL